MNNPWEELANAIITKATEDYRNLYRVLNPPPGGSTIREKSVPHWEDTDPQEKIQRIEAFFHSAKFKVLTNIDGDWLIRKLKEECIYDQRK